MQDSFPFRWLEERGPACQLIAVIDDATSRLWARLVEHDSTEENLRTFGGWLQRYGRPLAHYTDKNSIFRHRHGVAALQEQLRGEEALSQFGRALRELGIAWIAAHSPQAKGRIERLFGTLQDRLVKEMRLAGIDSIAAANHFLETRFLPEWEQRFTVQPRNPRNAHRRLDREHRLEEILSVRAARKVAPDHTVSWDGVRAIAMRNGEKPIRRFVLYSLCHTFLTRLGESGCDVWTLARIAGHSDIRISARYVHPSEDAVLTAMARLGGHKFGHTADSAQLPSSATLPLTN